MRYIENTDLREWVKDSLKKAIFQKAHALAVQTGCEILVKMKDVTTDPTPSQFYATGSLQKSYNNNVLRKDPDERCVSGETGLPSVDQSIQMGEERVDAGLTSSTHSVDAGCGGEVGVKEETAIPLHISAAPSSLNQIGSLMDTQDANIQIKSEVIEPDNQSLMTDPGGQLAYPMEDTASDNTHAEPQMTPSFQAIPSGLSMVGRQSKSPKYHIPISPKPYQCGVCHKAFRSVQVLQKHTQTFHMRSSGSSRGRGRGANQQQSKSLVYKHQTQQALVSRQAELDSQSFTCVICEQTFPRPELLSEHITNSHSADDNSLLVPSSLLGTTQSQFADTSSPSSSATTILTGSPMSSSTSQMAPLQYQQGSSGSGAAGLDISIASGSSISTYSPQGAYFSPVNRPSTSQGFVSPGSSSASKKKWSFQRKPEITIRTIMSAILLSAGPISTHYAVRRYGPKSLRTPSIPKELYLVAATSLQAANLGRLVTVKNVTGLSDTFIKKTPQEIEDNLNANIDLGSFEDYTMRFNTPPPACITPAMQASLIQHGLVPDGSFAAKPEKPYPLQPTSLIQHVMFPDGSFAVTKPEKTYPSQPTSLIQHGMVPEGSFAVKPENPYPPQPTSLHLATMEKPTSLQIAVQAQEHHGALSQGAVSQGDLAQMASPNGAKVEVQGTPPTTESPSSDLHVATC